MHGMWTRPVPECLLILSDISNDGGRKGPGAANARESQRYGRERAFLYSRDAHRIPLPALREHSRENQNQTPKIRRCNVHSDRHALQVHILQPPRLRIPWRDLPVDVDRPLRLSDLPMRHRQGPTEVLHPHGHPLRELLFLLRGEAERAEPARLAHGLGDRAPRVDPERNEHTLESNRRAEEKKLGNVHCQHGVYVRWKRARTNQHRGYDSEERNGRATHILWRACWTRCISCSPVGPHPLTQLSDL